MKRKRKCVARPWGESNYCDGCSRNGTKCPYRFKYRDLRNTKKGAALYGSRKEEACQTKD